MAKKILFITLEYPPVHGGVASYYVGLMGELERQGHVVRVIADDGGYSYDHSQLPSPGLRPPSPAGRGEGEGTWRGALLSRWIWPRWLRGYVTVRATIKKEKPDVLFVGQVLPLGTVAYLLRRRVPYVVFTHGMDVLMAQKSWRKRQLVKKIFTHARCIVANSEFTKSEVAKMMSGKKLTIVNNLPSAVVVYPCPDQNIATEVRQEEVEVLRHRLGLSGKRVLLTLGRVVSRKGHDLVLRALPEILKHVPNVIYVVAGDGPDLGRLQKMVNDPHPTPLPKGEGSRRQGEGLQSSVRFVGSVSDSERPLYYALCDLFVMPSRQEGADVEGFGLAFLEAALFGKPSIGGRSGGVPEAILDGKTGALVDPNDANALARTVVQLLHSDRLRHELGQNAKARAMHEFRWERQVERLISKLS